MAETFIFDYDDTLAANQHDYTYAKLDLFRWITDNLGRHAPDLPTLVTRYSEIDTENVKTLGFSMERFPTSCRMLYASLCEEAGIAPAPADLERAYALGMRAFDEDRYREQGLLPGVEETLDFLAAKGDELILLTKGDMRVQSKKLEATRMDRWFADSAYIVPDKDAALLRKVAEGRDPRHVWKVGNSVRSDITPALEAGLGALYVPWETWAYERDHDGVPEHPRLRTLTEVADIANLYDFLF